MATSIADLRKNYTQKKLLESNVAADPFLQFGKWWKEAVRSGIVEPNAMTLATVNTNGWPDARTVLLKGFSESGFVFFTNYQSAKGRQLEKNPRASLVFLWKELERQVRITGKVVKLTDADNDAYFRSRPVESQLGAVVSPQSRVIESRVWLDVKYERLKSKLMDNQIDRPEYWGGYRVVPTVVEFWQGRPGRLHDRLRYRAGKKNSWSIERLAP